MTASRKDRIFKTGLYSLGIACAFIFVISKFDRICAMLVSDIASYGDLYPELTVADFKVERVENQGKRIPANEKLHVAEADYLLIGDSFLDYDGEEYACSDEISAALNKSLYLIKGGDPQRYVAAALEHAEVPRDSQSRILLLECVERNFMYLYRHAPRTTTEGGAASGAFLTLKRTAREISQRWFTDSERRYQYLLNTSVLTAGFVESLSTLKFRQFGMMPKRFPVYSLNPPMVFSYFETDATSPTSYFYPHTQEDIEIIATHLAELSKALDRDWNLKLVLIPVPNKITVYRELATDVPYDDYLPRLMARLRDKGLPTVDLYSPFRQANEHIYYATDTHWNRRGVELAAKVIAEQLAEAGTSE